MAAEAEGRDYQRLDAWLWCARFRKTRAECARQVEKGVVSSRRPICSAIGATSYLWVSDDARRIPVRALVPLGPGPVLLRWDGVVQ